ncbi:MAG: caspase family protein [Kiritimatiellae bacterium]|nr:caspase family protein [Kiritimatiellia bacterium]
MRACITVLMGAVLGFLFAGCGGEGGSAISHRGLDSRPSSWTNHVPHYQALVIGISEYGREGKPRAWDRLETARHDAEAVARVLRDRYGFNVELIVDRKATRSELMAAFERLLELGPDDACLVYYAGHGVYDEKLGEGYWIPSDARRLEGHRLAREDWIWNSMVNRIVSASPARHVLVIADTCFGGSLFRGETPVSPVSDLRWYKRAIAAPSRYLITSGNIEPVLDSGIEHSAFAQEVLNFLEYTGQEIFSASELGLAVRRKVTQLTGQLVQTGPLASSAHAGGEFIFMRGAAARQTAGEGAPGATGQTGERRLIFRSAAVGLESLAATALALDDSGATRDSQEALHALRREYGGDPLVDIVASQIESERSPVEYERLIRVVDRLRERQADGDEGGPGLPDSPRPRVLACLGPASASGERQDEARAALYRASLRYALAERGGCIVVDRKSLDSMLTEMEIGTSSVVDRRTEAAIGRFLPASLLLSGEIIPTENGEEVYLRVVEAETSRVLVSAFRYFGRGEGVARGCREMADHVVRELQRVKPLMAKAQATGETLVAGVGSFHAVDDGAVFDVITAGPTDSADAGEPRECSVGKAQIVALGVDSSRLRAEWRTDPGGAAGQLWIREVPAE